MAMAQRTKNTIVLERDAETTVSVQRPLADRPDGLRDRWITTRHHFVAGRTYQEIRVRYTLTQDNGMLEDLKLRARKNASGTAQRGPATATPTEAKVKLDGVPRMVRHAANLAGLKITDGPLVVKVKLLEQPEPAPLVCSRCKQPLEAHEHVEEEARGAWSKLGFESNAPRTEHYWYCTAESVW